jgi:ATP-binding cassette, subfamily B, bacterial
LSDSRSVTTPQSDRPVNKDISQLSGIVRFLKPYKLWVLGALIALVVASSAVLAIGQALRRVVDLGFSPENAAYLDQYFLALLGVVTVLAFATFGRFYMVSWIGERVMADVRKEVYNHVISLSPAFFETTPTGEILSRLTTDTTLIQTVIGSSASIALRNILVFIGGSILLVITSPKLAGMVAIVVPLVVLPIVIFGRKVRVLSRESQDRIADVGARAGESIDAVRTVQAFGHEDEDRRIFGEKAESAFAIAVRRIRARGWLTAFVILLIFGAVDLVLWIGAKDVVANAMSGGELAAFVYYAIMTAAAVGALSEVWGDLQRAAGATGRLGELLQTDPIISAPENPIDLPTPPRGEIEFDKVTFHYPARPTISALSDFSLKINSGETIAIVGPSGAGKSTVFQMLLRYYDPESGSLKLDGVALPDARPGDVRARLGLVAQDPVIFAGDVWDNIRYGKPDASDDEVRAAAEAAQVTEFADRLPDGFKTPLGEKGVRLSGGQRQRIAIARAVLRNPAVLLLDEATSALDAESERLVQAALDTLMEGRTTLVIAHRLATIQKAGRIVVMEEGRIVASGRHDELLAEGGLYAHLAELQFGLSRSSAAQ